jgi:hypothetical protein
MASRATTASARLTARLNGVLIHDNVRFDDGVVRFHIRRKCLVSERPQLSLRNPTTKDAGFKQCEMDVVEL